jgi:NADH:ubiquinone oxidoreductase subunit 6 (subunit J)
MQIMIYVGGTLVLLIFGVMLTAQEAFVSMKTRGLEWIMGLFVGACLLSIMVYAAFSVKDWNTPNRQADELSAAVTQPNTTQMGVALTGARVDAAAVADVRLRRGMSGYLLAFEAVGIHLLVVLVGAAYLSRTKRFVGGRSRPIVSFEPRARRRHPALSTFLGILIVTNVVLAALAMMMPDWLQRNRPEILVTPPAWLGIAISLLFLLTTLLLGVVWGWQRWGLVALWLVPIAQGVVLANSGLDRTLSVVIVVVLLLPIAALTAIVCTGKPSVWSQMD